MLLEVKNLSVSYGRIRALWDVSLGVDRGEIVSLIGANGAGKSTLLKTIVGIAKPEKGDILFEERSLIRERIHSRVRKGIAYVPEGRRLFNSMTVEENLRMGKRRDSRDPESEIEKIFALFPVLQKKASQTAGDLSGGEQQMLAIGRALMSNPKLLLLDELSFGLAPVLFDRVLGSIQEINKTGVSILLAEQNAERALEISSRCYVIENGRLVMEGPSEELIDSPAVKEAYLGIAGEPTRV